ncbi:hypothetical protein [Hydrogenimonas cancrithermarum]|uniref:Uncharacterized protein n=1 Tax=Hydrogenimonas cancrithermarum TaxID=2993563 RepID=A0ABN6WTF9_9BACT|nr:hypothetical protein [Hydrogenimonas cancrithermarum]BDY11955.1 hypothetical protein HCR_02670 [Hydrogenimonas cancrithermarum]
MKKIRIKKRVTWGFNPVSRIVPSKKRYDRKRERRKVQKTDEYADA